MLHKKGGDTLKEVYFFGEKCYKRLRLREKESPSDMRVAFTKLKGRGAAFDLLSTRGGKGEEIRVWEAGGTRSGRNSKRGCICMEEGGQVINHRREGEVWKKGKRRRLWTAVWDRN